MGAYKVIEARLVAEHDHLMRLKGVNISAVHLADEERVHSQLT